MRSGSGSLSVGGLASPRVRFQRFRELRKRFDGASGRIRARASCIREDLRKSIHGASGKLRARASMMRERWRNRLHGASGDLRARASSFLRLSNAVILRLIAPASFVSGALIALFFVYQFDIGFLWLFVDFFLLSETFIILLSVFFASKWIVRRGRLKQSSVCPVIHLTQVNELKSARCHNKRIPQVMRWDFFGVLLSSLFGKVAGIYIPRALRPFILGAFAKSVGINLEECKYPLEHFSNLQEFFTRPLIDGCRPISMSYEMVSPVDGRVVVVGQVDGDRVEQVKGVTYSLSQFLGKTRAERPHRRLIRSRCNSTGRGDGDGDAYAAAELRDDNGGGDSGSGDANSGVFACGGGAGNGIGIGPLRRSHSSSGISLCSVDAATARKRRSSSVSVSEAQRTPASPSGGSQQSESVDACVCASPERAALDGSAATAGGGQLQGGAPVSSPPASKAKAKPRPAATDGAVTEGEGDADDEVNPLTDEDEDEDSEPDELTADASTLSDCVSPGNKLFHCVFYLSPKDYHRIHAANDFSLRHLRHFPGTLFPISPIVARLIPNLFALNERAVMAGCWKHGFYSLTAVGAYNVGSVALNFEPNFGTNNFRRDFRNPNLELFSYRGVGCFAYDREYVDPIEWHKGQEVGCFKLGSTVVLVFEAPADFQFMVAPGDAVRLGQPLGHVNRSSPKCSQ